jgi:flavin prenyltransferase
MRGAAGLPIPALTPTASCDAIPLMAPSRRLIVGITGASGSIFGIRLLERLRETDVETHPVLSRWGARTIVHETDYTIDRVQRLATEVYGINDQGAAIASGSFLTLGMAILPCSMRTLANLAHGTGDSLLTRAADVVLKEKRRLVLAVRETPLHEVHLENMLKLARMGAVISPPLPAFYTRPRSIGDLVDYNVTRMLDLFGIHTDDERRWDGQMDVGRRALPDATDA